jgi:hypothetical protein
MVSLQSNLSSLRGRIAVVGSLLALVGAVLLVLQMVSFALDFAAQGGSDQQGPLARYVSGLRQGAPFDLAEATHCIYQGTTHSDQRRIAVTENWLQWMLGHFYPPLTRTQNTERLLAGGLAECSERSQILKTLAEEAGLRCRFVGLSGHVVLEVQTPSGWRVADPDYGVVYPVGFAELQKQSSAPLIEQPLSAAGYPQQTIERYCRIVHSAEDNVVLPVGSALSPRLDRIERACRWLATGLPLVGLLLGIVIMRGARKPKGIYSDRQEPRCAWQVNGMSSVLRATSRVVSGIGLPPR